MSAASILPAIVHVAAPTVLEAVDPTFLGINGLTAGAAGIMAILLPILGAIILGLIKAWPILAKIKSERGTAERADTRIDLHNCPERLDALETRLLAGESKTHAVELRLVSALTAVTILATELQRLAPASSALRQAQRLLIAAYPVEDEMPAFIADVLKPLEDIA